MPLDLNYTPTEKEADILNAASFTCGLCNFTSRPSKQVPSGYIEAINFGSRIGTFCSPCASSLRLSREVSKTNSHGTIVYLPSLSQRNIINLVRIADTALLMKLPYKDAANSAVGFLKDHIVNETIYPFFKDNCSPDTLATAISMPNKTIKDNRKALFHGFRYVPIRAVYAHIYEYYYKANPNYFQNPLES